MKTKEVIEAVADCLVRAGSTFNEDKKNAYKRAIEGENNPSAKWLLQTILENAEAAEEAKSPLCDDTGIPHVLIEVGSKRVISGDFLAQVESGISEGLKRLPGRPMAVKGKGVEVLDQHLGMYNDPAMVQPAPFALRRVEGDILRVYVLMFGGGPAIRGKSYRVFHRHNAINIEETIIGWAKEACSQLGCTPCTLAIGIGRSHYEAANLMLQAQIDGTYRNQSDLEGKITKAVNDSGIGPMGLSSKTTVLSTFLKVGPARASGVRIVCLRPCCCFEPRIASVDF